VEVGVFSPGLFRNESVFVNANALQCNEARLTRRCRP
jgi:hypothetical protein